MALELIGGAILGVVFDQLQKEIRRVKENVAMFKSRLEELEETLEVLSPVIQDIDELNRRLNNRSDHGRETMLLWRLLTDSKKLVSECSKIPRWDLLKRSRHGEKLDNKISRFHDLYMLAHMMRDQKKMFLLMQETRLMFMSLNLQQGDSSNLTMELTASSSIDSSDLTMSLTASSTDPFHKVQQKIVMKVHTDCDGCRSRVIKIACISNGVSSVAIEGDEEDIMVVVTGLGVDAVDIINRLRTRYPADILSITDA